MKKVLVLLLIIQSIVFFGQQGGGEAPKPPKFISSDRVGIIYYEIEEVAENVKIKEDSDQFYDVAKIIRNYNRNVKEVAFLNSDNFKKLDDKINKALQRGNVADLSPEVKERERKEFEDLKDVIPNASKKIIEHKLKLNKALKSVLKEKQFKKWLKYQKKMKKTLLPERPNTDSNSGMENMNRSGFGGNRNSMQQRGGGFR